ncbi:MAG: hypothetical protein ACRDH9_11865 [Actinomycetota bacterium]
MKRLTPTGRLVARLSIALLAACVLALPAAAKSSKAQNDRDRMPNGWEKKHGLNVRGNDAREDPDGDSLVNIAEFRNKTDPQDADSDDDGFDDGEEVLDGTDPNDPDDNFDVLVKEEDGEDVDGDPSDEEGEAEE